jgi:hypothetical protein
MKKLLILAYDFPPYVSVGGLRPYSWYKHLKEFGVYPVVVTRQWDNKFGNHLDYVAPSKTKKTEIEKTEYGTIIRTPYKPNLANKILLKYGENKFRLIRKSISAFYELTQWFFYVGPKKQLLIEADNYLKDNSVDAIIATGDPFVLFKYASKLSAKYNIPWIADYRDAWTKDKLFNRNFINKYLEHYLLRNVSDVITVSDYIKSIINDNIRFKNIKILINGFDHDILDNKTITTQSNDKLNIAFAGTIYPWHPVESFLKIVSEIKENNSLVINLYGINKEEYIRELLKEKFTNLKDTVFLYKKLPNKDLINKLRKNNLLLLFNDYSISGTKIYDYLAVKRKILFLYSNDQEALKLKEKYYNLDDSNSQNNHLQEDIIRETNSGIIVENEQQLKKTLLELIKEFNENKKIVCNSKGIKKYSRKLQTQKLATLIHELT